MFPWLILMKNQVNVEEIKRWETPPGVVAALKGRWTAATTGESASGLRRLSSVGCDE